MGGGQRREAGQADHATADRRINSGPTAATSGVSARLTSRLQPGRAVHHFIYLELARFAPSGILDACTSGPADQVTHQTSTRLVIYQFVLYFFLQLTVSLFVDLLDFVLTSATMQRKVKAVATVVDDLFNLASSFRCDQAFRQASKSIPPRSRHSSSTTTRRLGRRPRPNPGRLDYLNHVAGDPTAHYASPPLPTPTNDATSPAPK